MQGFKIMKLSVLMSIYHKEDVQNFNRAMQSIWDEQTVKPNEVVLVEDGPLTNVLYQSISDWKNKLHDVLKVIPLKKNMGVGYAKNIGIEKCTHELIAVMDTDDVSLPSRFERQMAIFESQKIDVCGTWIGEFKYDENELDSYRRTPEYHDEIVKFAKRRSPVNHVTAMYKKNWILDVGNYAKYRTSEDYNLFVKLIIGGAKIYNIQESLVSVRMGDDQEARRGGLSNAIFEANVQREFYKMGFLNFYEFARNSSIGFAVRVLPKILMKIVFKLIRKL